MASPARPVGSWRSASRYARPFGHVVLNHINLCTDDVPALSDFFARFFGFELVATRGKEAFAILRGSDGFALNVMRIGKGGAAEYPEGFHVGFLVDQADDVFSKHSELGGGRLRAG
jgi:catechol 2,3-dioxygenase-like lactoylglutathione lyase family enzyme